MKIFFYSSFLALFLFSSFTKDTHRNLLLKSGPVFTLNLTGVKSPTAKIRIGFYKPTDKFPEVGKASIIKIMNPEKAGSISLNFTDIPAGHYALAMYQDMNGDEKLNKNFIGYPKEPFGFSRNFKPKLSAPKFEDCEIIFDETHTSFTVNLIN